METVIFLFIAQAVIVLVVVWIGWRLYGHRSRGSARKARNDGNNLLPEPWTKTSEVSIDPSDGRKYRLWFNKQTGERRYVPEDAG